MLDEKIIIESLKVLFAADGHEEILYPIIETYFRYATDGGSQSFDRWDIDNLQKAFNILGINESARDICLT